MKKVGDAQPVPTLVAIATTRMNFMNFIAVPVVRQNVVGTGLACVRVLLTGGDAETRRR